mgnify:CR=1 FL=1
MISQIMNLLTLNGYKRYLGLALTILGALAEAFPQYPLLAVLNGKLVMVAGIIGYQIGGIHADEKIKKLM